MNFKYYDTLSTLICGMCLLMILSKSTGCDIQNYNVLLLLPLAYVLGYFLNAFSALLAPLYFRLTGKKASVVLLNEPEAHWYHVFGNPTSPGFDRIRFYEYKLAVELLREELNDPFADEAKMFNRALTYSRADDKSRVPDFNAKYAFSRAMLTLVIVSIVLLRPVYHENSWFWPLSLTFLYLAWRRFKENDFYFVKEVLTEYLRRRSE